MRIGGRVLPILRWSLSWGLMHLLGSGGAFCKLVPALITSFCNHVFTVSV